MIDSPINTRGRTAVLLFLLIAVSACVKLFIGPVSLVGNFSSYQTIFGMIAKRYAANHLRNLWQPELFMIQAGKPGLELIFFPLISLCAAVLQWGLGGDMDFWGRLVSVTATSLNVFLVYRIARCNTDRLPAFLSAFFFACSPFVWVYGRNFQNEAFALLFLSISLYCVLRCKAGKLQPAFLCLSAIALGIAEALRIHFLLLTPGLLLFFSKECGYLKKAAWIVLSFVLPSLWHFHNWQLQQVLPYVHTTMFIQLHSGKTFPHPYLVQGKYYLHFLKNLVLWGVGPLGFGFVVRAFIGSYAEKNRLKTLRNWAVLLLLSWSVVLLIPQKFMDQHFYAIMAVLPMSALAGIGLASFARNRNPAVALGIAMPFVALTCGAVAFRPAYKTSPSDQAMFNAARFIRDHVPPKDWVVASHGSTGDLLYYADHLGWTFFLTPAVDRPFPPEMKVRACGDISEEEWERRNKAYGNSVDWLEYLREQGAKVFIVSDRKGLEANPALKEHLARRYTLISDPKDPFRAYRLSSDKAAR